MEIKQIINEIILTGKKINLFVQKHKKIFLFFIPFLIYLILSLWFFGPNNVSDFKTKFFIPSSDPEFFTWLINWWPYSIIHHLNPFHTNYIWFKHGYNVLWLTSSPFLGLLMSPITLIFNAVVSFNILVILSPILNALGMFYLLYYLSRKILPSLIGGYIFGFSSFVISELLGHTQLYFLVFIPLIILVIIARFNQDISKKWFLILSSLLLICQFLVSIEIITTFLSFLLLFGLLNLLFIKANRKKIISLFKEYILSGLIALVVLSPILYSMLIDYKYVSSQINSPVFFSINLLNFIIPTQLTYFGSSFFSNIASRFTGDISEQGGYLTIPLILIIIFYLKSNWKKTITKVLGLMVLIIMIASLGPSLHIDGVDTKIPLPWIIIDHIPILKQALPSRTTVYIFFLASIITTLWLIQKNKFVVSFVKYLLALSVIILLIPNLGGSAAWQPILVPQYFKNISQVVPTNSNQSLLILPYGRTGEGAYLQYISKLKFKLQDAPGFTPRIYQSNPLVQSFYNNTALNNFNPNFIQYVKQNQIKATICLNTTSPIIINELNQLNWPKRNLDNTIIYQTPKQYLSS